MPSKPPKHTPSAEALIDAVRNADKYAIEHALSLNVPINGYGFHGITPLTMAAVYGRVDIAQFLLEKGADLHQKNGNGDTPLNMAARNDRLEMATFLIAQGALVDKRNKEGKNALDHAKEQGKTAIIETVQAAFNAQRQASKTAKAAAQENAVRASVVLKRDLPAPKPFQFKP